MAKLGFEPEPWTVKQYGDFIAHEVKSWPQIIKASGVKLK
jgi:hypothetical protein